MHVIGSKFFLILLFVMLSLAACRQENDPSIQKIHSFSEVDFDAIQSGTLVIFGIDDTLIRPTDTYLLHEHMPPPLLIEYIPPGKIFQRSVIQSHPGVQNWDTLARIMLLEAPRPLIEPMIIQKINDLIKRDIRVIACTDGFIYGSVFSLKWQYEHLKSLGFQGSYGDQVFEIRGVVSSPGFYKGVLSAAFEATSGVLGAFLDHMHLHPKEIVIFGDNRPILKSIQEECQKRGIAFQGYLYKNSASKPWDEALIQFQINYLVKHQKWLTDEVAKEMMKHHK